MRQVGIFFIMLFCSSVLINAQNLKDQTSISVDTVLTGKFSIRALTVSENRIWYGANEGRFGFIDFSDNTTFEKRIVFDSIKPEFRSIAETSDYIFVLSVGSPALLYKIEKTEVGSASTDRVAKPKLVYREAHPKAFYDSMAFWNDLEGIAIGDPTEDCFSILLTSDAGNTWTKLPCTDLPKVADGEAAFAASNTNVIVKGEKAWIVSGGTKARVFFSENKGRNWKVFDTPIIQGDAMTGIYTADFYDENSGIIAGGNYDKPETDSKNKAITSDGGKSWKLVSENAGFGYASCIQFVPGSNAKNLVSVGATGLHYSSDGGLTWTQLLADKTLYTIRFLDAQTAYAAGKDKVIRIRFKK